MSYRWDEKKSEWLKENRGFSFEELVYNGEVLRKITNRSTLHSDQRELVVLWNDYVYSVPFVVENDGTLFLKTAHKDRNLNKIYNKK